MTTHRLHRGARRLALGRRGSVRAVVALLAVFATVLTVSGAASAYLTSSGSGTGSLTTGTLNVPTAVAGVQAPGTSTVNVSWTAPTGPTTATGYYVLRTPSPTGSPVAACGTSAAAPTTSTSCSDTAVAVGSYRYVVVAVFRSWTATSAPSAVLGVVTTTQTITFTSSPTSPTVGGTYLVTATGGASGNPVTFTSATTGVCTVSSGTVSFVHAGSCAVNANQAGNAQYAAAPQVQQTFTVAKAPQTVIFTSTAPSAAVVGGTGYTPSATGGASGNAVVLSIDATTTGNCSLSGGVVTYQHAGTCTVDGNQAGAADYLAGSNQQSYAIGKGSQAITFQPLPPTAFVGDSSTPGTIGGASGNQVVIASATPAVCTSPDGVHILFNAAGTCTITANQAGNTDYLAAAQATQQVVVLKKPQSITFTSTAPSAATYQGATYNVAATSSSGLAVALTVDSSSTSVCSLSGATVSFTGVGTCTIDANQTGSATYSSAPQVQQSFAVGKAAQSITFGSLGGKTFGNAPFTVTASASSGLAVAFTSATTAVCTTSGSTVTIVTAGTCTINANQGGNGLYLAASQVQQSFSIAKANQTITFGVPANRTFGDVPFAVTATSTSGLTVTVTSSTPAVCTVSGTTVTIVTAGSCSMTASQTGDGNYNAAASVGPLTTTIAKANQTITFNPTTPANIATSATLAATSTSGLTVTLTTTSAATICTITGGTTVNYIGPGNCVINANQAGNTSYNAAAQVQQTVVVQAPFVITGKTDASPQNSTRIQGTGTPGATVTIYICGGTPATCGPGSATLDSTSPQTATVLANGTWNSSVFSKLGTGSFTAQAVQATPSGTSNAFTFTNS
jgi:hypothetical protein